MITLSDFLNRLFDFDAGEDFDKLADAPRAAGGGAVAKPQPEAECGGEDEICKTDRKAIKGHLEWVYRYLQSQENLTTTGQNKMRLIKKLIVKLGRGTGKVNRCKKQNL